MEITKKDYLDKLKKASNASVSNNTPCGRKKLLKNSLIYFSITVALICLGIFFTSLDKSSQYEKFIKGEAVKFEYLNYKDNFAIWNKRSVGNDINVLLQGGKYLIKNDLKVSGTEVAKDLDKFTLISNASYLNSFNNEIVYRDNNDRHIYALNKTLKQKKCIYSGNSGEVAIFDGKIYFIDYDNNNSVYSLDSTKENEKKLVINGPVKAFVVINDTFLYLNASQELYCLKIGSNNPERLVIGVERFLLNGDIIVESQNKIIAFSPAGANSRMLYKSQKESMNLVGIADDMLYIQEDSKFYCVQNGKIVGETQALKGRIDSVAVVDDSSIYGVLTTIESDKEFTQVTKLK